RPVRSSWFQTETGGLSLRDAARLGHGTRAGQRKRLTPPPDYLPAAALAVKGFVPAAGQKSRRGRGGGGSLPMKNTMLGLEQVSMLETDRKSLWTSERSRHVM